MHPPSSAPSSPPFASSAPASPLPPFPAPSVRPPANTHQHLAEAPEPSDMGDQSSPPPPPALASPTNTHWRHVRDHLMASSVSNFWSAEATELSPVQSSASQTNTESHRQASQGRGRNPMAGASEGLAVRPPSPPRHEVAVSHPTSIE
eukprot:107842-Prymnesium_polylepis.1